VTVAKAVYNTPFGMATQIGINLYKVISGSNIGYVLEKTELLGNSLWKFLRIECPVDYMLVTTGIFPSEKTSCQKKIKVVPVNGNGSLPKNGNSNTYIDPNGNLKTETNWLLYGAIALGAYILLKG
jgi:hypothetical protein